jgi:hypothetical protein
VNHYDKPLRYIGIARCDKPTSLVLATNGLDSPALEIAQRLVVYGSYHIRLSALKASRYPDVMTQSPGSHGDSSLEVDVTGESAIGAPRRPSVLSPLQHTRIVRTNRSYPA